MSLMQRTYEQLRRVRTLMFKPRMNILATILLRDCGDHVLPNTSCLATLLQNIGFEWNRRDFGYRHGWWIFWEVRFRCSVLISYRLGVSYRGMSSCPAERSRTEVIGVEVSVAALQGRLSVSSRAFS